MNVQKEQAAQAALKYIEDNSIVGVGTGSTVNYFIDALASIRHRIEGAVASSEASAQRLKDHGIPVYDLNTVNSIPVYVDGTDEITQHMVMIKGGGGALTREKIIAAVAKQFVCIADESKLVDVLGEFPLPVEVIPMARSLVGREMVRQGGSPAYREGFTTDNGNIILDVHGLDLTMPLKMEQAINNITGVVCNGLFAMRPADVLLLGTKHGIEVMTSM